jgi:hypothetical protein
VVVDRLHRILFIADMFRNEFGRKIIISIRDMGRKYEAPIRITISGPKSKSENFVTRMEAERLRDLLNKALAE